MELCNDLEIKVREELLLLSWANASPFIKEIISSSGIRGAASGKN